MAKSVAIPNSPTEGLPQAQIMFHASVKEAVEQLQGARGNADNAAIRRGDIRVNVPNLGQLAVTAQGAGFSVSGVSLASAEDYAKLVSDVRGLMIIVQQQQQIIDALVRQLKGL